MLKFSMKKYFVAVRKSNVVKNMETPTNIFCG